MLQSRIKIEFRILFFLIFFQAVALSPADAQENRSCSIQDVSLTDSANGIPFFVQLTFYSNSVPSQKSILILPPTGGVTVLDRSYARNFCEAGFDVYLLQHWTDDAEKSDDLQFHQRFYSRVQRALDITLRQVKSVFIGLLGTSVGGIQAAQAASLQDRLNAVFVIAAGAPIPLITVDSDQKAMQDLKDRRFVQFHFHNREEYLKALDPEIPMDPFKLPPKFKNKDLGMVIAEEDTTVPTAQQKSLQELWKPRTVITFSNGHVGAIVKTWLFKRKEILEFFQQSSAKMDFH